jgi:hypothetical protein
MADDNLPPPEIEAQFDAWLRALHHTLPAPVRAWFDQQPKAAPPRAELPFERFKRQHLVRSDSPPSMPAWKDPRGAA